MTISFTVIFLPVDALPEKNPDALDTAVIANEVSKYLGTFRSS